ncbi:SRPBCC domain-containing protein [Lysinibacillus xylanilyticus]|uniref:SRPBCC family protein n=1 Tax=Lysinibacillus xylanilyticus TaxID=582475 RepID=UPI003830E427
MTADVSLDYQFTSSIEKVWNALTNSDTLEKWIWKNDFKPIVGHKFQFRAEPNEWWDGIVNCEVLKVEEPHTLSYTWASAGETTTVTWTLTEGSDGTTHLHLDQSGFSEATKARQGAIEGAKYAWINNGNQLEKVLAEL